MNSPCHCSQAETLLRLPGYTPTPAFRDIVDVPLLVRRAVKTKEQVREEFGIPVDHRILLFNFGGQKADYVLKPGDEN